MHERCVESAYYPSCIDLASCVLTSLSVPQYLERLT